MILLSPISENPQTITQLYLALEHKRMQQAGLTKTLNHPNDTTEHNIQSALTAKQPIKNGLINLNQRPKESTNPTGIPREAFLAVGNEMWKKTQHSNDTPSENLTRWGLKEQDDEWMEITPTSNSLT